MSDTTFTLQPGDPIYINFDDFDTVVGVITIPARTRFVRGAHNNSSLLGTYPMYFTHRYAVALGYARSHGDHGKVFFYETTRPLRLFDLRYMMML